LGDFNRRFLLHSRPTTEMEEGLFVIPREAPIIRKETQVLPGNNL
jgi:hypothetical protein